MGLIVSFLYFFMGGNLIIFLCTIFVVDIFMVGYLFNKKIGAIIYNIGHSIFAPIILWLVSAYFDVNSIVSFIAMGWIVHIAIDRTFGFGLKELTGFKDTHLGIIGKSKK